MSDEQCAVSYEVRERIWHSQPAARVSDTRMAEHWEERCGERDGNQSPGESSAANDNCARDGPCSHGRVRMLIETPKARENLLYVDLRKVIGVLRLRLFFALIAQRTILAQDDKEAEASGTQGKGLLLPLCFSVISLWPSELSFQFGKALTTRGTGHTG